MNGNDTIDGEYPFVVAIFYKKEYICTGTLISSRHIVTAAHCFAAPAGTKTYLQQKCRDDQECLKSHLGTNSKEKCGTTYLSPKLIVEDYEIGFGSLSLNKTKKLKLHSIDPNYQQFYHYGCHQNDLAILTLALDGNEDIRPYVCLAHTTDLNMREDEVQFTTLGWGKDSAANIAKHDILQKLDVNGVFSMKRCSQSWNPFPIDGICVTETDERNSCDGDSGGPLITIQKIPNEQRYRYVMVGLLSFGTDCDALQSNVKAETAVYTRLDFYQQKINDIIEWENENLEGFDFSGLY
uniref:Peptidase S1 domain-containing protein n=1 Tax=Panagrolaimus sp. ES5 TaxID=591445 RepID=A0AC34GQM4_9BILA